MLLAACRRFVSIVFCGFLFRSLCLKFPRKHHVMMNFLSSMLRDEVCFIFVTRELQNNSDDNESVSSLFYMNPLCSLSHFIYLYFCHHVQKS